MGIFVLDIDPHVEPIASHDPVSARGRGAGGAGGPLGARGGAAKRADDVAGDARAGYRARRLHYPFASAGSIASGSTPYAASDFAWFGQNAPPIDIHFSVGLDGLSVWLFGLASLLTFCAVLVSWESITDRPAGFYALLLLLETGMLGVFAAGDIILFYVFFEFTLIPLFFLIGIWGSEERRYAAMKFFLFTFAGSVLTFLGLLTIVIWQDISSRTRLRSRSPSSPRRWRSIRCRTTQAHGYLQLLVFLALFAGFAIKVPLFPLHTWLPLAHTQAPAAGSVLLAGVLLKLGCLRILAIQHADAAGGDGDLPALAPMAGGDRHPLWSACWRWRKKISSGSWPARASATWAS